MCSPNSGRKSRSIVSSITIRAGKFAAGAGDDPTPAAGEVVIRVGAATTCGTDLKVWRRGGHARMLKPPTLFGHEAAGEIVAIGDGVEGWSVGDRVVANNSAPCMNCFFCKKRSTRFARICCLTTGHLQSI